MRSDTGSMRPSPEGRILSGLLVMALAALLAIVPAAHAAAQSDGVDDGGQADTHRQHITIDFESEVFARRGDAVVTQADFDAYLGRIPEADRAGVLSDPERVGKILDDLMMTRLIAGDGIDEGLLEDQDIQAHLYQAVMVYLAEQQTERVKEAGELDDYTSQARELYLRNPENYRQEELVDFTHLLITTRDRGDEEARELIESLRQRVEDGEALGALITEYSEDPSAGDNYGRFRDRKFDELDDDFAAALRELDAPGEISEPVKTRFGWHIIRLDGYQEGGVPEFEEIADSLREEARRNHRQRIGEQYVRRLLDAQTELAPGAVDKLLERYPGPDELSLKQ